VSERAVLITGGTGFLGGEVLVRVLERTDRPVFLLARAADDQAAQERADDAVTRLYGPEHPFGGRVTGIRGDLCADGIGLSDGDRARLVREVGAIAHCGAAVSFDMPEDEALGINLEGSRRLLDLAEEITLGGELERHVHVSTAYIAGEFEGRWREDDLDLGANFRNTYESSKARAEVLVRERAASLPACVVRPSIVGGESDSGWTASFYSLYWPMRMFATGLVQVIPALPGNPLDVVPVDYVADVIFAALEEDAAGDGAAPTYHAVAGPNGITIEEIVHRSAERWNREPAVIMPPDQFARDIWPHVPGHLMTILEAGVPFWRYFNVAGEFDLGRGPELAGWTPPHLGDYFEVVADYADLARWGKRQRTRAEARERAGVAAPRAAA
jgi:thioester reductase-like protein